MSTEDDLRDVCLGIGTKKGERVWLRYEDRAEGVTIIGKQGTGKSTIFENLILSDLAHGTPGVVIDPHGLLTERVIRCATPEQAERIFLLEAIRTKPFGLNLLDVRDAVDEDDDPVIWAADSVVATVKKLYREDYEFLPRLELYLDLAARTLIPSRLTLLDAPRLFRNKAFRNECLARVPDATDRAELRDDWTDFDRLRPGEQIIHLESMVNRLRRLFRPRLIKGIVGSKTTTVPFDQVLDGNTMLLVRLLSTRLSRERCNFIGTLILCGLADRIFARKASSESEDVPRLHIYLDEYQRFATGTTVELIGEGRKYGAGTSLAHQALYQLPEGPIREASGQSATLVALALKRRDADELAGEFPIKPGKEWIETIIVADGTEPKRIPSPTAAEDIYINGHSDLDVDLAARSFLRSINVGIKMLEHHAYTRPPRYRKGFVAGVRDYPWQAEPPRQPSPEPAHRKTIKSDGVSPRPGGVPVDDDVTVQPAALNGLLYEAMTNPRSTDPDVFFEAVQFGVLRGELGEYLQRHFAQDPLRGWLRAHVAHLDALRSADYIDAFRKADRTLLFPNSFTGPPTALELSHELMLGFDNNYRVRWEILDKLRQRLRWLWILYEGLAKDPILIQSGEPQPHPRASPIRHPAQSRQDAREEFAGKLVNLKRHVAHVRMPRSYHRVKLARPMPLIADVSQVDRVRKLSQDVYYRPDLYNEPEQPAKPELAPKRQPGNTKRPRITRRPRAEELSWPEVPGSQNDEEQSGVEVEPEDVMQDQAIESEAEESDDSKEDWNVDFWNVYVESMRRDAEHEGKRFIVVSECEIVVEDIREPGDRTASRTIHRYVNKTNTVVSFRLTDRRRYGRS